MRLNVKQKIVLAVYLLTLVYLFSYLPFIKTLPCGCTFKSRGWIWAEPPILIDLRAEPTEEGVPLALKWSIDWGRQITRMLIITAVCLVFFLYCGR
jgi:hypothetical protein